MRIYRFLKSKSIFSLECDNLSNPIKNLNNSLEINTSMDCYTRISSQIIYDFNSVMDEIVTRSTDKADDNMILEVDRSSHYIFMGTIGKYAIFLFYNLIY